MLEVFHGHDIIKCLEKITVSQRASDIDGLSAAVRGLRKLIPAGLSSSMFVKSTTSSGKGYFADRGISAGECVAIDHPLASVLDIVYGNQSFSECDGGDTIGLLDAILDNFNPEVEACLRSLYPLREVFSNVNPIDIPFPAVILEKAQSVLPRDIHVNQLVRTIQLNSLGFYTLPELCSYDDHLRFLTGTGLYPNGSFFNHSCDPNVNHMSFGDVTVFRANRDVLQGEELCISYIGSDLLCESRSVREEFIGSRDFSCACKKCQTPEDDDPWVEELEMSDRIAIRMARSPEARAALIRTLLKSKNFIQRDEIFLKFLLARELGDRACSEWEELIAHAEASSDFLSVVIMVHYLVRFPMNEDLLDLLVKKAVVSLGPSLGTPDNLSNLFRVTDFPESSPFHEKCAEVLRSVRDS